ncbi:MAG: hypothetical protein JWN93_3292, partial [Hyphomicrobiales bacterium]|nr:hypothetical protein [Hyphomicrobiales bacterium]
PRPSPAASGANAPEQRGRKPDADQDRPRGQRE